MGNITGGQIDPQAPKSFYQDIFNAGAAGTPQGQLQSAIQNMTMTTNGPAGTLIGLPAYPGPTSPDPNQTLMPQAAANWAPYNTGTSYLANYLQRGGGQMNPYFGGAMQSIGQTGGIGGAPTSAMQQLARYGAIGGGGPGTQMAGVANTGIGGAWGNPLLARATGQPTAASAALASLLAARPYQARW